MKLLILTTALFLTATVAAEPVTAPSILTDKPSTVICMDKPTTLFQGDAIRDCNSSFGETHRQPEVIRHKDRGLPYQPKTMKDLRELRAKRSNAE